MIPQSLLLLMLLVKLTHCQYFQFIKLPDNEGNSYSVKNNMLIHFNNKNSSGEWTFIHPLSFQLKLISVEFNSREHPCDGVLRLSNRYSAVDLYCHQSNRAVTFDASANHGQYFYNQRQEYGHYHTMYIRGYKVKFTAIFFLSNFANKIMNNDQHGYESTVFLYTFQQHLLRSENPRSVYSSKMVRYVEANAIESGEMISFGDIYWPIGQSNSTLFPMADVPCCHADVPETCQWVSTLSPEYYNHTTNITGMAFKVSGNVAVFETRNNSLYMEKICINILYKSGDSSQLKIYVRQGDERKGLEFVSSSVLSPGENLMNRRLVGDVPPRLKGIPLQIIVQISASNKNPILIKQIYGCNPYGIEDRYEAPLLMFPNRLTTTISNSKDHEDENEVDPALSHSRKLIVFDLEDSLPSADEMYVVFPYSFKGLRRKGQCLHDGRLDGSRCICPAGFVGDRCQNGCGENKFGPNCESRCSSDDNKCKGKLLCQQNLGCSCAPGFQGRYCAVGCSDYQYGGGCRFSCGVCWNNTACDHFTGTCTKGCQPGYIPPLCQSKEIHLIEKPSVSEIDYNSAVISVNTTSDIQSVVRFYTVHYTNSSGNINVWFKTPIKQWPDESIVQEKLVDLKAGSRYQARLVVFNEEMSSYQGDDLPSVQFETRCIENELNITEIVTETEIHLKWEGMSKNINRCEPKYYLVEILFDSQWRRYTTEVQYITIGSLLPGTKYLIRIRDARQNSVFYFKNITTQRKITGIVNNLRVGTRRFDSIELLWENDIGCESSYLVEFKCLTMLSSQQDCQTDEGTLNVQKNRVVVEGLHPFRKYQFSVKELSGPDHSKIVASTKAAVPDVGPELLSVASSNSSVIISWSQPIDCSKCNGFITGYSIRVSNDGNNTLLWEETKKTTFEVKRLAPGMLYKFEINIINTEGKSSVPLVVEAVTKSTVPSSVVELEAYKTGRREIGLRWSLPRQLFGELVAFRLGQNLIKPEPCPAWPSRYCHTIKQLAPDTTYNFSVSARNDKVDEDGMDSFISATTIERAPEEPLNLTVYNETETSITVRWEPPNLFNGILRSFLIKVEQTESYKGADCCQYFPKTEIKVDKEQPLYEAQISGLSKGSRFAVSVMGETVWLGPAARTSACTRPPTPTIPQPPITLISSPKNATLTLAWPQFSNTIGENDISELIQDHLVMVLPASNETQINSTEQLEEDLKILLDKAFPTQRYYVAAHYQVKEEEEGVEVEGLVSGGSYQLALVAVAKYCHLYTVTTLTSSLFLAP